MKSTVDDPRLDALERHALAMTDALILTLSHVAALTAVNTALLATVDVPDRAAIRDAALAAIGNGPQHTQVRSLIEALTQEPASAVADHHADLSVALADLPVRLQ